MTVEESLSFCSLIINGRIEGDANDLRIALEKGSDQERVDAMKQAIMFLSSRNFTIASSLVMTIIRFVMPNQKNKLLKKLVLLFFELVPKVDGEGKLLSEMILLCNALRNDLQHPNEYVRGVTLRFLTRIREVEVLEPLLASVKACLEHRHSYVRRNAIMALYSIYLTNDYLAPDVPELVENILSVETDAACQRNAFVVLAHCEPERLAGFMENHSDKLSSLEPLLQLAIVDFLKIDSARNEENIPANVKFIVRLLHSNSADVKFEAASALMSISRAPVALKAVASTYVDLACKQTDNNSKLIALDRYRELQNTHPSVVNDGIMELIRVLNASDLEVRRRTLGLLLSGVGAREAAELVSFLVKEILKCSQYDHATAYQTSILGAIDTCANRFPSVSSSALSCFMDLLKVDSGLEPSLILDCIKYSKTILERSPNLRTPSVLQLLEVVREISDPQILCNIFWVLGEFSVTDETISSTFTTVMTGLGKLPIVESECNAQQSTDDQKYSSSDKMLNGHVGKNTGRKLNLDGTYATMTSLSSDRKTISNNGQSLRKMICNGEFGVAVSLGAALTKMTLNSVKEGSSKSHNFKAQAMLVLTSILRVCLSKLVPSLINKDSYDRLMMFLKVLSQPCPALEIAFADECRIAFEKHIKKINRQKSEEFKFIDGSVRKVDDHISFRLGGSATSKKVLVDVNAHQKDISLAVDGKGGHENRLVSVLSKIVQLTGFSDSIYAETYVTVTHPDVILDILLVNQTSETLQNVTIDLGTSGDLKLNEKAPTFSLSPHGFSIAKASIKVKSTDNGLVFGCISYGITEVQTIVLNSIHVDICEFIKPMATTNEAEFRSLWPTLEWENKINVPNIHKSSLLNVMNGILEGSHLACLTKGSGISESGEYLAANMYAQSSFGEDILANICLERSGDIVSGHLRLRSKTQGIAIALGDRITEIVTKMST